MLTVRCEITALAWESRTNAGLYLLVCAIVLYRCLARVIWSPSLFSPQLQLSCPSHWTLLYNSNQDGLGANRFVRQADGWNLATSFLPATVFCGISVLFWLILRQLLYVFVFWYITVNGYTFLSTFLERRPLNKPYLSIFKNLLWYRIYNQGQIPQNFWFHQWASCPYCTFLSSINNNCLRRDPHLQISSLQVPTSRVELQRPHPDLLARWEWQRVLHRRHIRVARITSVLGRTGLYYTANTSPVSSHREWVWVGWTWRLFSPVVVVGVRFHYFMINDEHVVIVFFIIIIFSCRYTSTWCWFGHS